MSHPCLARAVLLLAVVPAALSAQSHGKAPLTSRHIDDMATLARLTRDLP